jgi:hypothetical protein
MDMAVLELSGKYGQQIGNQAIVDDDILNDLLKYNWYCLKQRHKYYPVAYISGKTVLLHRYLLKITDSNIHIDHKNNNTLDARLQNLRIATRSQNLFNQIRINRYLYKGVYPTRSKKFDAKITQNKKTIHLGAYNTAEQAAEIYDKKALELFGEFANLNFPDKDYTKITLASPTPNTNTGYKNISFHKKTNKYIVDKQYNNKRYQKQCNSLNEALIELKKMEGCL